MKIWSKDLSFRDRTEIIESIKNLCSSYSDIFSCVILFGSTARDECNKQSDIDIYIESVYLPTTKLLRHKKFREFELKLYDIVLGRIEFDIIVVGRNEIKNLKDCLLYQQIEKDGIVLYDERTETVQEFNIG